MDVIPASSVMSDAGYGFQGHGIAQDKILEPEIQCETRKHGLYRECVYQLGDGLVIAHLIPNDAINSATGGPDELFCQLQNEEFGLSLDLLGESGLRWEGHVDFERNLVCKWPSLFPKDGSFPKSSTHTKVTINRVQLFDRKRHPQVRPLASFRRDSQQDMSCASLYKRCLEDRTKDHVTRRRNQVPFHFISNTLRKWFWVTTNIYPGTTFHCAGCARPIHVEGGVSGKPYSPQLREKDLDKDDHILACPSSCSTFSQRAFGLCEGKKGTAQHQRRVCWPRAGRSRYEFSESMLDRIAERRLYLFHHLQAAIIGTSLDFVYEHELSLSEAGISTKTMQFRLQMSEVENDASDSASTDLTSQEVS